jgi:hypothetical protein
MRRLGRIGWAKSYALERQEKALRYIRNEGRDDIRQGRISKELIQMLVAISRVEKLPRVEANKLVDQVWSAINEIRRGRNMPAVMLLSTVETADRKRRLGLYPSYQTYPR